MGIRRRIENSDIAVDSTGNGAFANSLGFLAQEQRNPLSPALFIAAGQLDERAAMRFQTTIRFTKERNCNYTP